MADKPWGFIIMALRVRADISQEELGDKVGLSQSQVSRIEKGRRKVTADELIGFSKALGVPMELMSSQRMTS